MKNLKNNIEELIYRLEQIPKLINSYFEERGISIQFLFPKDYIDYDISFKIVGEEIIADYSYQDSYDDILNEEYEVRYNINDINDDEKLIEHFLEVQNSNIKSDVRNAINNLVIVSRVLLSFIEEHDIKDLNIEKLNTVIMNINEVKRITK